MEPRWDVVRVMLEEMSSAQQLRWVYWVVFDVQRAVYMYELCKYNTKTNEAFQFSKDWDKNDI